MSDHPIPDDLVNEIAKAMSDQWNATMATGPRDATVPDDWTGDARVALTTLAEWAGGALIDPAGWRRVDWGELSHHGDGTLMEVVRPDLDPPEGGYREVNLIEVSDIGPDDRPVRTLTERGDR